jgi:aminoglycoside phosphotransferase (APT) family kinase protein
VRGTGLAPVHGDPNDGNLLVTADGPVLLDWETLHLSDPLHDLAQVLWWGALRARWPAALARFGASASPEPPEASIAQHAVANARSHSVATLLWTSGAGD